MAHLVLLEKVGLQQLLFWEKLHILRLFEGSLVKSSILSRQKVIRKNIFFRVKYLNHFAKPNSS